jgi:hypothetical protein
VKKEATKAKKKVGHSNRKNRQKLVQEAGLT